MTLTKQSISSAIDEYYSKNFGDNAVVIHTGTGGMDKMGEHFEKYRGFYRIYIGKKVIRILRKLNFKIKKSFSGRYYKLMKL